MTDKMPTAKQLNEQREAYLRQLQSEAGVEPTDPSNLRPLQVDDAQSDPTDRTETEPQQIAGATTSSKPTGNIIYAWQMQVDEGWNLIAMLMPNGQSMPLITTSLNVAWEAFEVAQAHANRHQCQCRLATFRYDSVAAIVDPNDE